MNILTHLLLVKVRHLGLLPGWARILREVAKPGPGGSCATGAFGIVPGPAPSIFTLPRSTRSPHDTALSGTMGALSFIRPTSFGQ